MKPLNEQTIKRFQKLAGISEIKVIKPGSIKLYNPKFPGGPLEQEHLYIFDLLNIDVPVWVETHMYEDKLHIYITKFYDRNVNHYEQYLESMNLHKDKESAEEDSLILRDFAKKMGYKIEPNPDEDDDDTGTHILVPFENVIINDKSLTQMR